MEDSGGGGLLSERACRGVPTNGGRVSQKKSVGYEMPPQRLEAFDS